MEMDVKARRPLRMKRRLCAVVLAAVLVVGLCVYFLVPHFAVFGWNYRFGRFIYHGNGFSPGCVLGESVDSLLLSHSGFCCYDSGAGSQYAPLASMNRIVLTKNNFDVHFDTDPSCNWDNNLNAEQLRQENCAAWIGYAEPDGAKRVICVLLQNDGSVIWLLGIVPQSNDWDTFYFSYGQEIQRIGDKVLYYNVVKEFLE